jgi:peptide/nickel transport system ATP-binding protein
MIELQSTNTPAADAGTARGPSAVASARNLSVSLKRHGQRSQVLNDVSLDILPGEILGLVGESGSGKSVFSLALLGLLPEASDPRISGSLRMGEVDMAAGTEADKRMARKNDLGAIFQDPMTSLNPTMRIGNQVEEAAGSKKEAVRLMQAVGIPQPERRFGAYPHELSGGLRQRVMIAMAIAGRPKLLIADEPTTALDVTVQAQVLQVLRRLRDEIGCSILMITHDLGVAGQIADRVAVMYSGQLVEVGSATDVLTRPSHAYTRGLLESRLDFSTDRRTPLKTLHTVTRFDTDDSGPQDVSDGTYSIRATEIRCDFPVKDQRGRKVTLQALRGVTLDIHRGSSLALVGESGSGKSTLLRIIAGLQKPSDGGMLSPPQSRVQMVFQDAGASLTPWLTVEELLGERLRPLRLTSVERRQRVLDALERVGLPPETLTARPAQLSGGQRQRVALARAIIIPPEVLLCDEPTSALDASLAASVLNLIQKLRRELGMAVVFVTHDLSVARIIGDRIAVMYLGRIVELGKAEEIIRSPKHPYTQALIAAVPGPGVEFPLIVGEPASPIDPPDGCAYHPRCPVAVDACSTTKVGIQLVRIQARSHDDIDPRSLACIHRGDFNATQI